MARAGDGFPGFTLIYINRSLAAWGNATPTFSIKYNYLVQVSGTLAVGQ